MMNHYQGGVGGCYRGDLALAVEQPELSLKSSSVEASRPDAYHMDYMSYSLNSLKGVI